MAMKKWVYIGIDLGNDCGYAVMLVSGKKLESGTWRLKPGPKEMKAARWINFAKCLRELIAKYKTKYQVMLTYEYAPFQKGKIAAFVYGGWLSQLEIAEAENRGVIFRAITVAEWKASLTGSSKADKPAYIAAVNKRYGMTLGNHKGLSGEDEAAAIGVAFGSIALRSKLLLQT